MTREISFVEAINETLIQEMARDENIVLFGENIRGEGRSELQGLQDLYGDDRVIDFPISEAAMTGMATGAALAGARPVIHYQVSSLIFPAFDQLVDQAAKLPLMLGGQAHLATTYLIMGAGASGGRAGQHSDNPYPYLIHAGIKTVMPSTPSDAKGLLASAICENDPVAFLIPVRLATMRGPVAERRYAIPLAQGEIKRKGRDISVVAVGHLVGDAMATAEVLIKENIDVEVWDPRSLLPLDRVGLAATVKKTGRVILFDDSHRSWGYAAELSSIISETCFRYLKAPIKRITRGDITIPFSKAIEAEVLPSSSHLEQAIRVLLAEE